jgi:hypothetical protein
MYQASGRISINIGSTIYSPRGKAMIKAAPTAAHSQLENALSVAQCASPWSR